MARPSKHTEKLALTICERIAAGESVRQIGEDNSMPAATTIHQWVLEDKDGFSKQYATAKSIGAEQAVDEMEVIARTEDDVARARLIIDTRKWSLSKQIPKKYGDKIDMTTNGKELPTPLFGNINVQTDNSTGEDTESE